MASFGRFIWVFVGKIWSPVPGLNQRHPVYKTGALPTELTGLYFCDLLRASFILAKPLKKALN
jgi:hypothetical protein